MKSRLLELLDAHLDNRLTPAEKVEFENALLEFPEARRIFWERTYLHGLLHEALRIRAPNLAALPVRRPVSLQFFALAAILALALFSGLVALMHHPTPRRAAASIAQLTTDRGSVSITRAGREETITGDAPLSTGDRISVGSASLASIRYEDGTLLRLEGNTQLTLEGDDLQRIALAEGRIQAAVTPRGNREPMQLITALAQLTVHGTRFLLDAEPGATRLDVAEGLVQMAHTRRDSDMDIGAGQFAVAVSDAPLLGGVTPVALPGRALDDRPPERLILQPFDLHGPWNQALSQNAHRVAISSPVLDLAGRGMAVHPAALDRPIYVAKADDPLTAIVNRYDGRNLLSIRVPAAAFAQAGRLLNVTVMDEAAGVSYELIQADRAGDLVRVMLVNSNDLRGPGFSPAQVGHTWSGLPLAAGVIRAGELQAGIQHALAASALHTALSRTPDPSVWPAHSAPMERKLLQHMASEGNVHFGSRLALPDDLDLASLGIGYSGPDYEVARALQRYGLIITHSYGPAETKGQWVQPQLILYAEESESALRILSAAVSKLAAYLQVVENPSEETTP